jgi:hypothetical protein
MGFVESTSELIAATNGSFQEAAGQAPSSNGRQVRLQGHGTCGSQHAGICVARSDPSRRKFEDDIQADLAKTENGICALCQVA